MAKKERPVKYPAVVTGEKDGKPFEVERYGDPAKIMYRDNASSALGWLIYKGHLNSMIDGPRTERAMEIAWNEGRARINTAQRLENIFEAADLTPIRSPDFEAVPGGTFGPRAIHHSKLRAIKILADLERDIPPLCMGILRAIIGENRFIWHGLDKRGEREMLEAIRMSLDFAAWSLDRRVLRPEMTEEEIVRRWPAAHQWFTVRRLQGATYSFKRDDPPEDLC